MKTMISKTLLSLAGAASIAIGAFTGSPALAQDALSPYIGTIRYFGFGFAPRSWAFCDGQLIGVSQNEALFSLLGTTYGGDGRTTFGLPDMRSRVPVHWGTGPGLSNRPLGQKSGAENVTLNANQIGHTHTLRATTGAGNQSTPTGNTLAQDGTDNTYLVTAPSVQMHAGSISSTTTPPAGGGAHNNMPPFLGVYCNIALFGVYPSRN